MANVAASARIAVVALLPILAIGWHRTHPMRTPAAEFVEVTLVVGARIAVVTVAVLVACPTAGHCREFAHTVDTRVVGARITIVALAFDRRIHDLLAENAACHLLVGARIVLARVRRARIIVVAVAAR